MKKYFLMVISCFVFQFGVQAQIVISDFSSIGTQAFTPFNSTWNGGTGSVEQFTQGAGFISITSVNSGDPKGDGSFDALIAGSPPVNFTSINNMSVTARIDAGNVASSFRIIVRDSSFTNIGFADFNAASFSSSFTTGNATFTFSGGGLASDATYWALAGDGIASNSFRMSFDNLQASTIPEPSTYALMFIGFGTLLFIRRKTQKI